MTAFRPIDRVFEPAPLTGEVVDLSAVKEHERIVSSRDDAPMLSYLVAAQVHTERMTQRLLTARTCILRLMATPCGMDPIELPGGVVASVTSVMVDGVAVTGCSVFGDSPARLYPAAPWPVATGLIYPVVVTYVAGFAALPEPLAVAIKMLAGEMYNRRETSTTDQLTDAPFTADHLIAPYRIRPI